MNKRWRHRLTPALIYIFSLAIVSPAASQATEVPSPNSSAQNQTLSYSTLPGKSISEYARALKASATKWIPSTGIPQSDWARALLDPRIRIDDSGRYMFVDEKFANVQPNSTAASDSVLRTATRESQTSTANAFTLHSRPGSNRTIYLNFTGTNLYNTTWANTSSYHWPTPSSDTDRTPWDLPNYDIDNDPTTYSSTERQNIIDAWSAVVEDYAPFDVDITTEAPPVSAINRDSSTDLQFGMEVNITEADNPVLTACNCGGIASGNSFRIYPSQYPVGVSRTLVNYYKHALVFPTHGSSGKIITEIISHEVGHTLSLLHDGTLINGTNTAYYTGRDGWAPIMGAGYYHPLTQWSNGSYTNANQTEDDLARMSASGVDYLVDDYGDTLTSAQLISPASTTSGVIASRTDVDTFTFIATKGSTTATISFPSMSPDLDTQLTVFDSAGTIMQTVNPDFVRTNSEIASGLDATATFYTRTGSRYYIQIDGVGFGSGTTTGYTDYASIGGYILSTETHDLTALAAGSASVSGDGTIDTDLIGSYSGWPAGADVTTEWFVDSVGTGNTTSTYRVARTDVGKSIVFKVTGSKDGFNSSSVSTEAVTPVALTFPLTSFRMIGSGQVGSAMMPDMGTWPSETTFSYEWYRDTTKLSQVTDLYAVLPSDLGKSISLKVTATSPGYSTLIMTSDPISVVPGIIGLNATPRISGTVTVGKTLTVTKGIWMIGTTLKIQWLRNGANISRATGTTYKLTSADFGKRIAVRVTGSATGYTSVTKTSAQTVAVKR